ncbi:MAG: gamma-glutamylcyclotransferase, partial [Actinobacteria bacterium]|nr:gamma-glutamylcyclotransferase [Actinomycetota bacterium]NIS37555.1 gamma-glutamylcyclotransferase [Actinomycetota bacterium]NIU22869.1 gamma-glutamylcyclotransferase [Actinomycetota bacterium]NIU71837.1 gamma-glutamylcyclotransferase [Actinomycetota bacterium]NIV90258.1 hypothetical protein [Actinomycetota bacterium]
LEIDAEGLAFLDVFESVGDPVGYLRREIAITTGDDGPAPAWAYLKDRSQLDVVHDGPMADYQPDPRYVKATRRSPEPR